VTTNKGATGLHSPPVNPSHTTDAVTTNEGGTGLRTPPAGIDRILASDAIETNAEATGLSSRRPQALLGHASPQVLGQAPPPVLGQVTPPVLGQVIPRRWRRGGIPVHRLPLVSDHTRLRRALRRLAASCRDALAAQVQWKKAGAVAPRACALWALRLWRRHQVYRYTYVSLCIDSVCSILGSPAGGRDPVEGGGGIRATRLRTLGATALAAPPGSSRSRSLYRFV